jgi:hypothetical protein
MPVNQTGGFLGALGGAAAGPIGLAASLLPTLSVYSPAAHSEEGQKKPQHRHSSCSTSLSAMPIRG